MPPPKVIVFGPTGAVGSAAALTASELGAPVILAMRDPSKPIPVLSDLEKAANFTRIYADLTKPDTVHAAISTTGAKHAFLYCAHGTPDHMKATVQALKAAGIEFVVFLSSYTVRGDLEAIPPAEAIPYVHAQVEIQLREVFGEKGFVAARPGSFASNTRQYAKEVREGEVRMYRPGLKVDCIVPEDIGRVCGGILVRGPRDGEERAVYLYGPELLTQEGTVKVLEKVLGKEIKVRELDEGETYKMFMDRGTPEYFVKYMINLMKRSGTEEYQVYGYPVAKEELLNVEKYSGRKATTFEEWAEQNKESFVS
ncbi:NAD(P)-binding protein [Mollisia scopiformis]|uniref:NAD(P)-binding protein n=1 Tax=Mollisia scopiformis TaxID=149040 RepID=A0A132BA69_MOLSC|nr:NAD(P)-binding protein [Mollisia scopiformis]KUJ09143.1 NAD(P)-binding protein [Mollisia scopiformis]